MNNRKRQVIKAWWQFVATRYGCRPGRIVLPLDVLDDFLKQVPHVKSVDNFTFKAVVFGLAAGAEFDIKLEEFRRKA